MNVTSRLSSYLPLDDHYLEIAKNHSIVYNLTTLNSKQVETQQKGKEKQKTKQKFASNEKKKKGIHNLDWILSITIIQLLLINFAISG